MSDEVTTVSPRVFYTLALEDEPDAHVEERLLLQSLLEPELVRNVAGEQSTPTEAEVSQALQVVGVDIACVESRMPDLIPAFQANGFTQEFRAAGLRCLRAEA
jgi:hypothetical protein